MSCTESGRQGGATVERAVTVTLLGSSPSSEGRTRHPYFQHFSRAGPRPYPERTDMAVMNTTLDSRARQGTHYMAAHPSSHIRGTKVTLWVWEALSFHKCSQNATHRN